MANKYNKGVSGSVQEKRGMLYLVVSYKDPITQKSKVKWIVLVIPSGSPKSMINKAKRDAQSKFENEYRRFLDGYDDLSKYPLLPFLNDWLDKAHIHKIQESMYYGYKSRVNGKMKKYFSDRIALADCKPRLIHGFYDCLREDSDSEQTVLHYHNLLHTAFEYAIRQEIHEVNPMDRVERPQVKKFVARSIQWTGSRSYLKRQRKTPFISPSSSRSTADCDGVRRLVYRGAISTLRTIKSSSGRSF